MIKIKPTLSLTSLALALLIGACSSDRPSRPSGFWAGAEGDNATKPVKTDDVFSDDSDGAPLSLLPTEGSTMRFLDARGLTKFYQNIFKQADYGFLHCKYNRVQDSTQNMSDCTESIFDKNERPDMGSFDLHTPRMGRGPASVNPAANLTLNYSRTLRAALSRECKALVEAELLSLKANTVTGNYLIKAAAPTAADLNNFMLRILGLSGTSVKINFDAAGYASDFATVVAASKDKNQGQKDAFIGVCIAIAMDPIIFIY